MDSLAQNATAERKRVKGVYRIDFVTDNPKDSNHLYSFCKEIFYSDKEGEQLFLGESWYNEEVLKLFPEVQGLINYNPEVERQGCGATFFDDCDVYNNLLLRIYSWGIYSTEFYYPDYPDMVRSSVIYQLEAEVIEYKNVAFCDHKKVIKNNQRSYHYHKDCWQENCPYQESFLILVRAIKCTPLTQKQIRKMKLTRMESLKIECPTHWQHNIWIK